MALISLRRLLIGTLLLVTIAVYILSNSISISQSPISQFKTSLPNIRKLQPSNIHRAEQQVPRDQMPIDKFISKSYASDTQLSSDSSSFAADNTNLSWYEQSDVDTPTEVKDDNKIFTDMTTITNASWGKQGMVLKDVKTSAVKDTNTSYPFIYLNIKSRRNSPGKTRIIGYYKKKLPIELKTKVSSMIEQYNEHSQIPFLSLSSAQLWYVFTEFMNSIGYQQRLPRVINIGVKKSGTTALGFFIGEHPQISHSFGNEVHFFDKPEKTKLGINYYRSKMGFSTQHQVPFEKTPKYFITKSAPKMIYKHLPKDIKFLLCVRDPVKRAISEYHHDTELMLRNNKKSELAKAKLRTPEEQGQLFVDKFISSQGYVFRNKTQIQTSIYSVHFRNWLNTFPRDRFMIVDLGKLEGNTYRELKRIEKFLGLDSFFRRAMMYNSEQRGSCLKINGMVKCPGKSTPGFTQKAKLNSSVERIMYDFYRPYNQEFAKLIGKKFDWMDL